MSATEMDPAGPEVEVMAKATRRRFTVEFIRKIVPEADGMIRMCFRRKSPSHPSEAPVATPRYPHASHLSSYLSIKTVADKSPHLSGPRLARRRVGLVRPRGKVVW